MNHCAIKGYQSFDRTLRNLIDADYFPPQNYLTMLFGYLSGSCSCECLHGSQLKMMQRIFPPFIIDKYGRGEGAKRPLSLRKIYFMRGYSRLLLQNLVCLLRDWKIIWVLEASLEGFRQSLKHWLYHSNTFKHFLCGPV